MRGEPTSVGQEEREVSGNDLRLPAINAARLILYLSSHPRADQCCAAIASARVARRSSNEPERWIWGSCVELAGSGSPSDTQQGIFRDAGFIKRIGGKDRPETMIYETIQFEVRGSVCVVTLNRPDRLNALTVEVARDFRDAVRVALENGARAIVLTGSGRAFCAGGDLSQMQELASREGKLEAFFDEPLRILHEAVLLIRQTPVPFIAAVNGAASGAGCNLALACDLVVAAESARFNQAFVKIGLSPDCGGTFILPRLVGWKRAAELMFTGDIVSAQQALEMGMINAVVGDGELMGQALAMAERLAGAPTAAIAQTKKLLEASAVNDYQGQLELERKAQIASAQTKDFAEGVAAFLEKRPPRFVGG